MSRGGVRCLLRRFPSLAGGMAYGFFCLAGPEADGTLEQDVPTLRALKVEAELVVDGVLDEPFWRQCEVAGGLIDTRTHRPAEQQTTVRVAYTRTHLYIGVECFDDQIEEVRASERRKDRVFTGDDWVEIHLDPTHSHRGKYAFFTNPLGTRAEANEGPSGMFNYGWTVEWNCAARIETNRWVFEMKIPLATMNYERRDGQTWGFNVTRALRRTDSFSFWSFNPTDPYKPRHFGHLTGLDLADARFDRQWEVTPYASARADFGRGQTDTLLKAGGDVSFRLTPSITTALTLNPDYGQVEADDATIELRDTERFLPEKRLFFREGEELIRMPHRLYYSRRFTDIDGGAKITGQQRNYSFIFQNLYSETRHLDFRGHGNSALLRVYQHVRERDHLGYYLADSELEQGHSCVAGMDGYYFLTDDWRLSGQGAVLDQALDDPTGTFTNRGTDFLGHAAIIYDRYPWELILGGQAITKGFQPLLGYIPRRNIFGPNVTAEYHHTAAGRWYKQLRLHYDAQYWWNGEGRLSLHDHAVQGRVVFPNDLGLRAGHSEAYHAPFHNPRTRAAVELFASDFWRSVEAGWAGGTFENIDYHELNFAKPFKPWDRLPIRYEFTIRFEEHPDRTRQTAWLNRIIFDLYLTNDMWVKASLQHQAHGVHNLSVIYGWEFLRRKNFYLVFNSVNDGAGTVNSLFSKITWTF